MKYRYSAGFSLVELSIVMIIMATIAGSAISVAITKTDGAKYEQTELKMDVLEEALVGFLTLNKRLPCPADGSLALSHANFGVEQVLGTSCDEASIDPYINAAGDERVLAGVVPVATLQLPDEFMFDGWGRRITYAIDKYAGEAGATNNFESSDLGKITILAAGGAITKTSTAVMVLVSHGENGYGAWFRNGGSQIYTTDAQLATNELENTHLTAAATITGFDEQFIQDLPIEAAGTTYFDDIVRYQEKWQLVREAGAILSESVCSVANAIVQGTGAGFNTCVGAADEAGCDQMATEVDDICLKGL